MLAGPLSQVQRILHRSVGRAGVQPHSIVNAGQSVDTLTHCPPSLIPFSGALSLSLDGYVLRFNKSPRAANGL